LISITPKAGFVTVIVNSIYSVRHIHWFTGQVWCNDSGFRRFFRSLPDRFINKFAHQILADSRPQRNYLLEHGFNAEKILVCANGSISGVDPTIKPRIRTREVNSKIKIGVVGRLCKDKGLNTILDLIEANGFDEKNFEFHFFGDFDDGEDDLRARFESTARAFPSVLFLKGSVLDKTIIYKDINLVLSASFREGFSNTLIEAQYSGIPVIVRNIYANYDAFVPDRTGFFFDHIDDLISSLEEFQDNHLYQNFSSNAITYVEDHFLRSTVLKCITEVYEANCHIP